MAAGFLELEQGTQPAVPAANDHRVFVDSSDGRVKKLDSIGVQVLSNVTIEDAPALVGNVLPTDNLVLSRSGVESRVTYETLVSSVGSRLYCENDDFNYGTLSNWQSTNAGSGSSSQTGAYGIDGVSRAIGVWQMDTGTTSTGRSAISKGIGNLLFGYAFHCFEARAAVEDLSNSTERYVVTHGFGNHWTTATPQPTNGVVFVYDESTSVNWLAKCFDNGIETSVDTGFAVSVQYQTFRIDVTEDASQALFYINGTLVATITTNIPVIGGQFVGQGFKIQKSNGTGVRNFSVDFYEYKAVVAGGR
jgi:hypothetical protein